MKQLLANLNWTFFKAWWKRNGFELVCRLIVGFVIFSFMALCIALLLTWRPTSKPKELTPLDMANILTEKVNKQNAQIRKLETELDQVKRQLAGELPQIHGGKTFDLR